MKKYKKIVPLLFIFLLSGCLVPPLTAESVSVVNWNVQTFFDGISDGCEYSDFKGGSWSQEKYADRLSRLCDSIQRINADIFVFEEIENDGVLFDISNQLSGNIWSKNKTWPFACFRKNPGDSIGCAVLSRFPINSVKLHKLDIRTEDSVQPAMRAMMEVSLSLKSGTLILLVNHWKSKSGGEEESEVWRNWQESVMTRCFIRNRGNKILAAGDFNRDISEFELIKPDSVTLERIPNLNLRNFLKDETAAVYSPWIRGTGNFVSPGSYYYKSRWERIDHFFASPEVSIKEFYPLTEGPWCSEETYVPNSYKIYSGYGYSDHLPIYCSIE